MGFFDRIFGTDEKDQREKYINANKLFGTLTAYKPVFRTWNGALYESALVRSAIDARARHIAKLRIEFNGSAKPYLVNKLRQAPNTWQTWSQFLYRASTILDCTNNLFIVPVCDDNLETVGYMPVLPDKCKITEDKNGKTWLVYEFRRGELGVIEFERCVLMTKYQFKNDFFGETNHALDDTMKLITIQNQGIEEAVKNSATYRFMANVDNFTFAEDLKKERERFNVNNMAGEQGGLLLFPNTYHNVKQIDSTPYTVDAPQMELIQTNITNYFGTNEDILQNKAYGDSWSAYYEGAIEPWAIQFSEGMTKALYTQREQTEGNLVIATSNRLQYLSNSDKLRVSAQMSDRGIMTANEIRDIWNLPPVPGGDVLTRRGEYYVVNEDGTTTKEEANNE